MIVFLLSRVWIQFLVTWQTRFSCNSVNVFVGFRIFIGWHGTQRFGLFHWYNISAYAVHWITAFGCALIIFVWSEVLWCYVALCFRFYSSTTTPWLQAWLYARRKKGESPKPLLRTSADVFWFRVNTVIFVFSTREAYCFSNTIKRGLNKEGGLIEKEGGLSVNDGEKELVGHVPIELLFLLCKYLARDGCSFLLQLVQGI